MMRTLTLSDPKCASLRAHATLNSHPEKVTDALFQEHHFCDPRDLLQVKYEMLRRVRIDGWPVGVTATGFGFSRVWLYQLRKRFESDGLAGLLPQRKGPRKAHKLSDDVLTFVLETLKAEPELRTAYCELATTRGQGIWHLSPSSQYRKSAGTASKKGRSTHAGSDEPHPVTVRRMAECTRQYEILRRQVLEDGKISNGNALEITFIACRGLAAWLSYVPPSTASADLQTAESESPGNDLIVALADLVLGNRLEEKDDPRC